MKNWLVCASSAHAAELMPAPVYNAPAVAAPSSPGTGSYAGLGLGFRTDRTDATTTSLTGSFAFKFDWGTGPVVAKY